MTLDKLPMELFEMVLKEIGPEDIVSFAMVNQSNNIRCQQRLDSHRLLKSKYNHLELHPDNKCGLSFLSKIASAGDRTQYPTRLTFNGGYCADSRNVDRLIEAVTEQVHNITPAQIRSWVKVYPSYRQNPLFAISLGLFPNLRHVTYELWPNDSNFQPSKIMIKRILQTRGTQNPSAALLKLKSATVIGRFYCSTAKPLSPFLHLPLHTLRLENLRMSAASKPLCPAKTSTVNNLIIRKSQFSGRALASILDAIKELKSFEYNHERDKCGRVQRGPKRSEEGWSSREIVAALLDYARTSLISLTIKYDCHCCARTIISLSAFNNLQNLTLSANLLPFNDLARIFVDFAQTFPALHYLRILEIDYRLCVDGDEMLSIINTFYNSYFAKIGHLSLLLQDFENIASRARGKQVLLGFSLSPHVNDREWKRRETFGMVWTELTYETLLDAEREQTQS